MSLAHPKGRTPGAGSDGAVAAPPETESSSIAKGIDLLLRQFDLDPDLVLRQELLSAVRRLDGLACVIADGSSGRIMVGNGAGATLAHRRSQLG